MLALSLRFPAGRYHATPWGRHVNEAAVAWPPEPLRLVRALIAAHYRKADRGRFSDDALSGLIEALAEPLPIFRLPPAVNGHTRHYMPINGKNPALVFDAFVRIDPDEPLVIGWPDVVLSEQRRLHLDHLAACLGYLGRAESWTEATLCQWDGADANACPLNESHEAGRGADAEEPRPQRANETGVTVPVYAPLTASDYRDTRERLIAAEREHRRAGWTKRTPPTDKALHADMRDFKRTLPARLADALALDTAAFQSVGWSIPPMARRVLYRAPEPTQFSRRPRRATVEKCPPTVARYVLAGRPRPRVEDTIKIAEIMRRAALAQWPPLNGERRSAAPAHISGYGEDGRPSRDPGHGHAFWLPEDADGDGELDHILVFAARGFDSDSRHRLDRLTRLWVDSKRRPNDASGKTHPADDAADEADQAAPSARREWRLALEGFGCPKEFQTSSLISDGKLTEWESVTPYLMPWHPKGSFAWTDQIKHELQKRGLPELSEEPREMTEREYKIDGRVRRPIHFHRFRSRRGLTQPDTLGRFVRLKFLEFATPFHGPLAIGFGCHFGMGLFRAGAGGRVPLQL